MTEYTKPALTFEQQADQLIARGLICDRAQLVSRLESVNYYRLSGYWFPFRNPDDTFRDGTDLTTIWRRYTFDRQLRMLMLDAIERVEVRLRTELAYWLSHAQGPFGFEDPANLPGLAVEEHERFMEGLNEECGRSGELFIAHFKSHYGDEHQLPPYWMVTELMTFGALFKLYKGSPRGIRKLIAYSLALDDNVLRSWLLAIGAVRNTCAHHGRLWNRELGVKPIIPKKDIAWHSPVDVGSARVFGVLTILKYLLDRVAPQSEWPARLKRLLADYPEVPLAEMGFPTDWEACPIWS